MRKPATSLSIERPILSPTASTLVAELRAIVEPGRPDSETAPAVAAVLARFVAAPDLLTPAQREPDPGSYKQHIVYVDPSGAFSVVALVWLPGQHTRIHDHICWCVVGVRDGAEREVLYRVEAGSDGTEYLVAAGESVSGPGDVSYFYPPGDIHEVANASDDVVISIHVYGADIGALGTSIRRCYDLEVRA